MTGYMSKEEFIRYLDCIDSGGWRKECADGSHWAYTRKEVKNMVVNVPDADVVPVRHARWIPTHDADKLRCSHCDVIHLIAQYPHGQINYCPNCGARCDL